MTVTKITYLHPNGSTCTKLTKNVDSATKALLKDRYTILRVENATASDLDALASALGKPINPVCKSKRKV